jgi:VanZ family protein
MTVKRLSGIFSLKGNPKRIYHGIAVILWMGVIFYLSSQNAVKSSGFSTMFSRWLLGALSNIGLLSINDLTAQDFFQITGIIRTGAHFFEYFVFGAIVFKTFRVMQKQPEENPVRPWRNAWIPICFCLFYALTDEIHQYFVPGRAMQLEDWLVDAAGVLIGILLMLLVLGRHRRKYKKANRNRSI